MDPYKTHEVYFDFKHSQFQKSLMGKHHNIKDKRIILFMKHLYLKNIVNGFQISIIVASPILPGDNVPKSGRWIAFAGPVVLAAIISFNSIPRCMNFERVTN